MSALALTTSTCFFANSWLIVWVLLEINTLCFCSLSFKKMEMSSDLMKESLMKYLVVQSIASAILILTMILKETNKNLSPLLLSAMVMALMIKMAAAPFHTWFIQVSKKSSWLSNQILFTWQKMIPTYLVVFQPKKMIMPFIIASAVLGSLFLMNKKSFKEIMALSSVFNISWMLAAVSVSLKMMLTFSLIYWTSLIFFIKEITRSKMESFNEKDSSSNKVLLFSKTINLAGIPPLMLFTAKWMTFYHLVKIKMMVLPSLILILSSVNIYIYLRMASTMLLKNTTKEQKNKKGGYNYKGSIFLLTNIITLQMLT
uniref:NADH-ubiquinone oxidoreductase chain 2 n=1 Tax=Paraleius leontonychus TaxID=1807943 RepID=A0A330JGM0_9ACAR|nr:NADH dehydrogenase subunit 2 [Paraleius leontonychus]